MGLVYKGRATANKCSKYVVVQHTRFESLKAGLLATFVV